MTGGSHDHPDKYLGDASRTVRRHLADCPRGGCYSYTMDITVISSVDDNILGKKLLMNFT